MKDQVIAVFGGSGFLGGYIVRDLLKAGATVKIYSDIPSKALPIKLDSRMGKLESYQIDICDQNDIKQALYGATAVINLIGNKSGSAKELFITHVLFPKLLARCTKELNITKFIHFSCIGVDRSYESNYAHSKYEGDQCVHRENRNSIIIRPHLVFGQDDNFITRLIFLLPRFALFPVPTHSCSISPIYAGDVSRAVSSIFNNYERYQGKILELQGKKKYTLQSIIDIIFKTIGKRSLLLKLPKPIYRSYIALSRIFPDPIMSKECLHLLNSSVRSKKNHLNQLDINSTDLETFVKTCLKKESS